MHQHVQVHFANIVCLIHKFIRRRQDEYDEFDVMGWEVAQEDYEHGDRHPIQEDDTEDSMTQNRRLRGWRDRVCVMITSAI